MLLGVVGFGFGCNGLSGSVSTPLPDETSSRENEAVARLTSQVQAADARATTNPSDPAAWAALAIARVRLAQIGENFDNAANSYTAAGRRQLTAAGTAWDTYIGLDPSLPEERLARSMTQAFLALEQPAKAVSAWEVVTDLEPAANSYTNLALLAYQAGQIRKGDRASTKAQELTKDAEERQVLKEQLEQVRSEALVQQTQENAPTPTPTSR